MSDANETHEHNPDALIEGNRVATAEDMESSEKPESGQAESDKPGYEGEAPNAPLASQGSRDGTAVGADQNDADQND